MFHFVLLGSISSLRDIKAGTQTGQKPKQGRNPNKAGTQTGQEPKQGSNPNRARTQTGQELMQASWKGVIY